MVKLSTVQAANASYIRRESLVVVSAGGTSGIGEQTLRELCTVAGKSEHKGAGLRLYLIARNQETAERLTAELRSLSPAAEFVIVHAADLALLKDVDEACREITEAERARAGAAARIDLLLMTQAIFDPWLGRKGKSHPSSSLCSNVV